MSTTTTLQISLSSAQTYLDACERDGSKPSLNGYLACLDPSICPEDQAPAYRSAALDALAEATMPASRFRDYPSWAQRPAPVANRAPLYTVECARCPDGLGGTEDYREARQRVARHEDRQPTHTARIYQDGNIC